MTPEQKNQLIERLAIVMAESDVNILDGFAAHLFIDEATTAVEFFAELIEAADEYSGGCYESPKFKSCVEPICQALNNLFKEG